MGHAVHATLKNRKEKIEKKKKRKKKIENQKIENRKSIIENQKNS